MRLKDSLSQNLLAVQPEAGQPVKIYSCGPTIYDYPHLGNWFAFLRWDLLVRSLRCRGFKTLWVMNMTDVGHLVSDADEGEDKLDNKALKERKTAWEIAAFYGAYFLQALERLNFLTPDHLPKASDYIDPQINLVKRLEERGLAYVIDDGVYYDTAQWPEYGKLAQSDRSGLQPGSRVDFNPQKRNATDFALWKLTPAGKKKDMEWDSPWGRGSPGWHLECSAMSQDLLGLPIDIHTGGIDHIPIHHTNELAQTEAAWQQNFAKIWVHSNFVTYDGEKMSKSLNNFYTLEDMEARGYGGETLRLTVFAVRYSKLADFNWQSMANAQKRLRRLQALAVRRYQLQAEADSVDQQRLSLRQTLTAAEECLADDLNSPLALEKLDTIASQLQTARLSQTLRPDLEAFSQRVDQLLGLKLDLLPDLTPDQKTLFQARAQARENSDFQQADRLRQSLNEVRIAVSDTDFGQIWQPL